MGSMYSRQRLSNTGQGCGVTGLGLGMKGALGALLDWLAAK